MRAWRITPSLPQLFKDGRGSVDWLRRAERPADFGAFSWTGSLVTNLHHTDFFDMQQAN